MADLDALYVNFISGYEMTLATAQFLRRGFGKLIYADLHSLFLGKESDGTRVLQPLVDAPAWFGCVDVAQLNEAEMQQLGDDPLAAAAAALAQGCHTLLVTLGARGAAYFVGSQDGRMGQPGAPIRSGRVAPDRSDRAPAEGGDPTGCGDVFGATVVASLLAGTPLADALQLATRMAARNVTYRGATGLRDHLLGKLTSA